MSLPPSVTSPAAGSVPPGMLPDGALPGVSPSTVPWLAEVSALLAALALRDDSDDATRAATSTTMSATRAQMAAMRGWK